MNTLWFIMEIAGKPSAFPSLLQYAVGPDDSAASFLVQHGLNSVSVVP